MAGGVEEEEGKKIHEAKQSGPSGQRRPLCLSLDAKGATASFLRTTN